MPSERLPHRQPASRLPADPDLPPAPAPLHRQPGVLLAVALGGAVGAPLRHGLGLLVPAAASGFPRGTLLVNLVGCLLLGALVEALALRARAGTFTARYARPFAGSGLLGAFTTYSTFAVETDRLLALGRAGVALAYVLVSLVGGLLAAAAGVAVARRASS